MAGVVITLYLVLHYTGTPAYCCFETTVLTIVRSFESDTYLT